MRRACWPRPTGSGAAPGQQEGLLDSDAVRAPLLTLEAEPRAALAGLLRGLGVVESAGGRIGTLDREAVA